MKNTQKKLKAKHFRYLTKEIIDNPMDYLDYFFEREIDYEQWKNEIRLIILSSCYPEMISRKIYVNGSFYCKELIKQVEMAYVIFFQIGIKRQKKESLRLFKYRRGYFNYTNNKLIYEEVEDPYYQLGLFFSYMTLAEWYETLDDIWLYMTMGDNAYDDRFGDRIIIIQELLLRIAFALHSIHLNRGMELPIPPYCYVNRNEEDKSKE